MKARGDRTYPVPVAGMKLGMREDDFRIVARQSGLPFTDEELAAARRRVAAETATSVRSRSG